MKKDVKDMIGIIIFIIAVLCILTGLIYRNGNSDEEVHWQNSDQYYYDHGDETNKFLEKHIEDHNKKIIKSLMKENPPVIKD